MFSRQSRDVIRFKYFLQFVYAYTGKVVIYPYLYYFMLQQPQVGEGGSFDNNYNLICAMSDRSHQP